MSTGTSGFQPIKFWDSRQVMSSFAPRSLQQRSGPSTAMCIAPVLFQCLTYLKCIYITKTQETKHFPPPLNTELQTTPILHQQIQTQTAGTCFLSPSNRSNSVTDNISSTFRTPGSIPSSISRWAAHTLTRHQVSGQPSETEAGCNSY